MNKKILIDSRWQGAHGIGRFSQELLNRLDNCDPLPAGPKPLSLKNLYWLPQQLNQHRSTHGLYFTPGFNPVLKSPMPYILCVHDLIHLHLPSQWGRLQKIYYESLIKPSVRKANCILTASEFSKKSIQEWAGIPAEKIQIFPHGVSESFRSEGEKYSPDFPYLLHVGSTKKHKNVLRLLEAFSQAQIDPEIRLIFTGPKQAEMANLIDKFNLKNRVIFSGSLQESDLANYYRGALALVFPSLYEGFGLPPLEAMASGIPVLTANATSIPEVVGDAALLVDPRSTEALQMGIEKIIQDPALRKSFIEKGKERAKLYTWEKTAACIQEILNPFLKS